MFLPNAIFVEDGQMHKCRWLIGTLAFLGSGCAEISGPLPAATPEVALSAPGSAEAAIRSLTRAIAATQKQVDAVERERRATSPFVTRMDTLDVRLGDLRGQLALLRGQLERVRSRGAGTLESMEEVDAAGYISTAATDLEVRTKSLMVKTHVMIVPAVLDWQTTGSVTGGGATYPISIDDSWGSIPIWRADTPYDTPAAADCALGPVSGTVTTLHRAGWNVKGLGPVIDRKTSADASACVGDISVSVELNSPTIYVGEMTQAVAYPVYGSGTAAPCSQQKWASSNPGVASVSSAGMVTGVSAPSMAQIFGTCVQSDGNEETGGATVSVKERSTSTPPPSGGGGTTPGDPYPDPGTGGGSGGGGSGYWTSYDECTQTVTNWSDGSITEETVCRTVWVWVQLT